MHTDCIDGQLLRWNILALLQGWLCAKTLCTLQLCQNMHQQLRYLYELLFD